MNTLILNRESFEMPADGWYQIAPVGEFPHSGAGVVQVVDRAACDAMVNAFRADALKPNFAGLLIDFDHFSLDEKLKSEAAGWVVDLENRESGLWGKIRWSDLGEDCVKGGRYRFISPVWARSDCESVGADPASGQGKLRPVRLMNAALTNDPNLKGMVPLSNRAEGGKLKAETTKDLTANDANLANGDQHPTTNIQRPTSKVVANGSPAPVRLKWVLGGNDRNCPSCAGLDGQVHSAADWNAAGILPGAGKLYCQGNCHCQLVETDEPENGDLASAVVRAEVENRRSVRRDEGGKLKAEGKVENRKSKVEIDSYNAGGLTTKQPKIANRDLVDFLRNAKAARRASPVRANTEKEGRMDTKDDLVIAGATAEELANALRFEREKNKVLMDEVVVLEDELVNRDLAGFGDVVQDETREFWRDQLLHNRKQATVALKQMVDLQAAVKAGPAAVVAPVADGKPRPMHNRATAKPVQPGANGAAVAVVDDGKAGQIRNRAHAIRKADGVPFSVAFRRAEREMGEKAETLKG